MPGYGGQMIALDGNDTPIDVASPLIQANQITGGQIANQGAAFQLALQKAQLAARMGLANTYSGAPAPVSPLAAMTSNPAPTPVPPTPSMQIGQAAVNPTDSNSWDAAMNALVKKGVTEAGQFVGRYTPKLQQQVVASYGAEPTANATPQASESPVTSPLAAMISPQAASPLASIGGSGPATSPASAGGGSPIAPVTSPLAAASGMTPDQQSALARYAAIDPEGAKSWLATQSSIKYQQTRNVQDLSGNPQAMAQVAAATKDMSEAQKTTFNLAADFSGRLAQAAATIPAGPQRDAYVDQGFAQMKQNGLVSPDSKLAHDGPVTDQVLQQIMAKSMAVQEYMKSSGQEAGNVARAQLPSELTKIAATGGQARLTQAAAPFNLGPGDTRFSPGGGVSTGLGSAGVPPPGGATPATGAIAPSGPPAQVGTPSAPAPQIGVPRAAQIAAGQNPGIIEGQKAGAEQWVKYQGDLSDKADAAVKSNNDWDNMRADSQTWQQGKFADSIGDAKSYLASMANQFGLSAPEYTQSVADWTAFNKSAGGLLRDAAHAVSSRVGVQEMQLIGKSLPTDETSAKGFGQIADQMQGVNDFVIAKNAAATNYSGANKAQFESQFDQNVSPVAFIVNRMSPDDYATFANNLKKTDAGKQELNKIVNSMQFADKAGLFQSTGQ